MLFWRHQHYREQFAERLSIQAGQTNSRYVISQTGQVVEMFARNVTHNDSCAARDFENLQSASWPVREMTDRQLAKWVCVKFLCFTRTLTVHRTSSCFGDRTFAAAATTVWNSLPADLRNAELSYSRFTRSLKTFLFRQSDHGALWTFLFLTAPCKNIRTYLLLTSLCYDVQLCQPTFKRHLKACIFTHQLAQSTNHRHSLCVLSDYMALYNLSLLLPC